MKFNKWTLGLAAVGAVSMASAVRADEAKLSQVNTALSATTLSGYVDVAAQYNLGAASKFATETPVTYTGGSGVVDGFSVNDVDIALDKPEDDSPWASGYHIELNAGQDAVAATIGSSPALRQAYVSLRTPIGNGIDWKFGAFDGVTGYESNTGYSNPNYTRSYGWLVNPASEVGLLGTYKICNEVTATAGIVNRDNAGVSANDSSFGQSPSSHSYVAMVALTAPDNWGWAKGSTLNVGTVQAFDDQGINNYNASLTLNTPVAGLKAGFSMDRVQVLGRFHELEDGAIYGFYGTYQQTDKLSYNVRAEYADFPQGGNDNVVFNTKGEEVTFTVEYDIWANVTSRAEFRWDHDEYVGNQTFNANGTQNAYLMALNLVYKF
jgi:hypothetical protein